MGTKTEASRTAPPLGSPPEGVRAAVTVALCLVLVGLVLSIAANSPSGPSALLGTIKSRLFAPVLAPAWLDLGFDQRLTYGLPDDAEHDLEVTRHDSSEAEPLFFPGGRRGEQAARWRRLARAIALGDAQDDGSVVAAGVGRGGFDDLGVEDVVVRVLRQPLRERTAPADAGTAEQVYDARVRLVADQLQLIKDEAKSELAPLVKPPAAPRNAEPAR